MHRLGGGGLTDFVMSKVVMSVCALLVVGGLAEVVATSLSPDAGGDLEALLADLQRTISGLLTHGGDCAVEWPVPALPSGSAVHMSFRGGSVSACADGMTRDVELWPVVHAWAWDGLPLNVTRMEELDSACGGLDARTGDAVTISASIVLVEDCPEVLMFVA